MGLFNFWKKNEASLESSENSLSVESNESNKENYITIMWGTGMPIDVIYNFIQKDFEEQGYKDALVNSDLKYRESRENIIKNELKLLFNRILLRYQSDIRDIDVKIKMAEEAYAISSASMLSARKVTFEEHIKEIHRMERLLEENDPEMTTMIESYRRGFLKGIVIQTVEFIENK